MYIPKMTANPQKQEESLNRFTVILLRKNQHYYDVDFGFLSSGTLRQYISGTLWNLKFVLLSN
jgi:hypothetical protein